MLEHQLDQRRIVVARAVCHGKPRVAGTRIMVYQVLDLLVGGKSIDILLEPISTVQGCTRHF